MKGLPSAPEWGCEWGIPRRRATGRGGRCRCRSRSCAGPHRLPGQPDLTELWDGGVGNPGSSSWRQRPGRVFRVKVGGQFPPGAVLPPCHQHYPSEKTCYRPSWAAVFGARGARGPSRGRLREYQKVWGNCGSVYVREIRAVVPRPKAFGIERLKLRHAASEWPPLLGTLRGVASSSFRAASPFASCAVASGMHRWDRRSVRPGSRVRSSSISAMIP